MESNKLVSILLILTIYMVCVFVMQGVFYGSDLTPDFEYKENMEYTEAELNTTRIQLANQGFEQSEIDEIIDEMRYKQAGLPAWYDIAGWFGFLGSMITYLFSVVTNMLAFNVPAMPFELRLIIMSPIWVFVGLFVYAIMTKFIHAIGNIIPLTMVMR